MLQFRMFDCTVLAWGKVLSQGLGLSQCHASLHSHVLAQPDSCHAHRSTGECLWQLYQLVS